MSSVVDRFIIAEATKTFRGHPKPLLFAQNRERYAGFLDRIDYIVVDDMPPGDRPEDAWRREAHQRRALMRGVAKAGPDDMILLSDVDEIPRAGALREAMLRTDQDGVVHCFNLRMFLYFLNLEDPRGWCRIGPRLIPNRRLTDIQMLRRVRSPQGGWPKRLARWGGASLALRHPVKLVVHRDAGWHFSYMNGQEAVIQKLNAYSHPLRVEWRDTSWIAQRISAGMPLRPSDTTKLLRRTLSDDFPCHLLEHRDRFERLILPTE